MSRVHRAGRAAVLIGLVLLGGAAFGGPDVGSSGPSASRSDIPWGTARELTELAERLEERRRDLDRREAGIVEKESALAGVTDELTDRLTRLETLRAEISVLLDGLDDAREERVDDLVRRVESMRDAQAAPLLAATDPELAVEVLRRMSPSKAGKALAKMNPTTAAKLAERLAAPIDRPEGL